MLSSSSATPLSPDLKKRSESDIPDTFWRSLQTFDISRIVIATALLVYWGWRAMEVPGVIWLIQIRTLCIAYLGVAVIFTILRSCWRHKFNSQVVTQITVDIIFTAILFALTDEAKSGLAILFLFPLAGASILMPMVLALFFSSIVTLFLLLENCYRIFALKHPNSFLQVGLDGAAFIAIVFVTNRLAAKLIKQEKLAIYRGKHLEAQQAINRVVIADVGDGVLVVDTDGYIVTCNPAAERMLGLAQPIVDEPIRLSEISSLVPISHAFFSWLLKSPGMTLGDVENPVVRIRQSNEDTSCRISPGTSRRDGVAHLKLRFVTVETPGSLERNSVIFLQDITEIENKAQQLKLASMGRLTASIAHEVRNPLSAISHAAGLLSEELEGPVQKRLLTIISENVARVNRMVEDILKLSRKAHKYGHPIELGTFLQEIKEELENTQVLSPGVLALRDLGQLYVRFDPLHLREAIVNLLANAARYASNKPGSIKIYALGGRHSLELHVQDDGPTMSEEVRAHLFEPFFTTSSKGTGLGLYMARELCLNNGAILDYEYRIDYPINQASDSVSGRFVITFSNSESTLREVNYANQ